LGQRRDDFYLTASRLVPYKRMSVLVDAFGLMADRRLVIIGDGPERERLQARAGPNVTLLGYQDTPVLRDYLERARAFLFAAREDFGIVLVEAQAAGTPVIAFGQGGAVESIRGLDAPHPTGVLFSEQTPASVVEALRAFEQHEHRITPAYCRLNALRFGIERFRREFASFVDAQWQRFDDNASQGVEPSSRRSAALPVDGQSRQARSRRAA
ncbi:MAG: glycosyltransferase, partial [Proteobacteria bacterium]|nr:glycosyltransferase [Pseudomonadota bacterium]